MTRRTARTSLLLSCATLALAGCASTTPLQLQRLRDPGPSEGAVVGSVWIKGGRDILGRTRFELAINEAGKTFYLAPDYTIEAQRGGEEELFAAVLPAANYRFIQMRQPGFSNVVLELDLPFRVEAGKTTYIGRLIFEFPDELISLGTPVRLKVEDARDAVASKARSKYGRDFSGASVALIGMAATGSADLPGTSTANAQLANDTLATLLVMDGAHDQECTQRTLENREIVSASPEGAKENWTIRRCGKRIQWVITYRPDPAGGTFIGYAGPEEVGK